MRITNNMLVDNMIRNIGNNLSRMEIYQMQLATGKRISKPSDDPVVAARALKLRTDVSEIEQFQRNVKDAQSWLEMTENTLGNIGDVVHRIRELTVQAGNGTNTADDTVKIAEEVKQLKTQLINLANTTYAGRNIFSGFKTDKALIESDEKSADFGKYNITVSKQEMIKYEIGIGDSIIINVPGGDLFEYGGEADEGDTPYMISDIDNLINALMAGNTQACSSFLENLDTIMDNTLRVRADTGARINRLELSYNRLETDYLNFNKLMSENEDIDMSETIINLKNEENIYRASLAGGARIIMPSLIDFLR